MDRLVRRDLGKYALAAFLGGTATAAGIGTGAAAEKGAFDAASLHEPEITKAITASGAEGRMQSAQRNLLERRLTLPPPLKFIQDKITDFRSAQAAFKELRTFNDWSKVLTQIIPLTGRLNDLRQFFVPAQREAMAKSVSEQSKTPKTIIEPDLPPSALLPGNTEETLFQGLFSTPLASETQNLTDIAPALRTFLASKAEKFTGLLPLLFGDYAGALIKSISLGLNIKMTTRFSPANGHLEVGNVQEIGPNDTATRHLLKAALLLDGNTKALEFLPLEFHLALADGLPAVIDLIDHSPELYSPPASAHMMRAVAVEVYRAVKSNNNQYFGGEAGLNAAQETLKPLLEANLDVEQMQKIEELRSSFFWNFRQNRPQLPDSECVRNIDQLYWRIVESVISQGIVETVAGTLPKSDPRYSLTIKLLSALHPGKPVDRVIASIADFAYISDLRSVLTFMENFHTATGEDPSDLIRNRIIEVLTQDFPIDDPAWETRVNDFIQRARNTADPASSRILIEMGKISTIRKLQQAPNGRRYLQQILNRTVDGKSDEFFESEVEPAIKH